MTFHIGITGPPAAGKSTLASQLADALCALGKHVRLCPMAEALKELTTALVPGMYWPNVVTAHATFLGYGVSVERSWIAARATADAYAAHFIPDEKPRVFYQVLGTEIGRVLLAPDIWIRQVQAVIQKSSPDVAISDDIRFDNEAQSVDLLVGIDWSSPSGQAAYARNCARYSGAYLARTHCSEHGIGVAPHLCVPCGFSPADVRRLAEGVLPWLSA